MAVVGKDDLLKRISDRIGEDNSDEAIALIEDFTDTVADYESRIGESGDWKQKYDDNDAMWREKYRKRFMGESDTRDDVSHNADPTNVKGEQQKDVIDDTREDISFDDLFEEREGK